MALVLAFRGQRLLPPGQDAVLHPDVEVHLLRVRGVGPLRRPVVGEATGKDGTRRAMLIMIHGEPHVLKHIHVDTDWTMRFFHETSCIPLDVWRAGLNPEAGPRSVTKGRQR